MLGAQTYDMNRSQWGWCAIEGLLWRLVCVGVSVTEAIQRPHIFRGLAIHSRTEEEMTPPPCCWFLLSQDNDSDATGLKLKYCAGLEHLKCRLVSHLYKLRDGRQV